MKKIIMLFSLQKYVLTGLLCASGIMHGIRVEEMVLDSRFLDPRFREARPDVVARYEKTLDAYERSPEYQEYDKAFRDIISNTILNGYFIPWLRLFGTPDDPTQDTDILSGNKSIYEINKQILLSKLKKALHQRDNSQEHHDFLNSYSETADAYSYFIKSR